MLLELLKLPLSSWDLLFGLPFVNSRVLPWIELEEVIRVLSCYLKR